ncbi:hypothetical protein ACWPM1_09015 [Tsuneonella sp. HG249]
MTMDDMPTPRWRHPVVIVALTSLGLMMSLGIITGVVAGTIERGTMKPLAAVVLVAVVALVIGCGLALRRVLPRIYAQSSPRVTQSRRMLTISALIGGGLGLLLALGSLATGQESPSAFSNAPMAGWMAIAVIAVWLLLVPPITWKWHRSIDEHEASAYRDGTLAGMYAYCAIAPTWWFGWRGGFLPEPQEMITFLVVITVWGIVWLVRRYG